MRVLFIHGLESGPHSSKAVLLAKHFDALTPAMDTRNFRACVELQARKISEHGPEVVVGSSFGGAVTIALLQRAAWAGPTLLLAPAHRHFNVEERLPANVPVIIVHGIRDTVVDIAGSRALAKTGSPGLVKLIEVDDEHRLQTLVDTGQLAELVRRVQSRTESAEELR